MEKLFSFSQRNNFKNKKIEVSFNVRLRTAVIRVLKEYSSYAGWDNSDNWSFERAEEMLMTFYGVNNLSAFDNNKQKVSASFEGMMLSGYPSEFIDGIESWFKYVELNKLAYAEKEDDDLSG